MYGTLSIAPTKLVPRLTSLVGAEDKLTQNTVILIQYLTISKTRRCIFRRTQYTSLYECVTVALRERTTKILVHGNQAS